MTHKSKLFISAFALTSLIAQGAYCVSPDLADNVGDGVIAARPSAHLSLDDFEMVNPSLVTSKSAALEENPTSEQKSSSGSILRTAGKAAGGFLGTATLTDLLTNNVSQAVRGAATAATGSSLVGKAVEIAAFNTVYGKARTAAYTIGSELPGVLYNAPTVAKNVWNQPSVLVDYASDAAKAGIQTAKSGVQTASTQAFKLATDVWNQPGDVVKTASAQVGGYFLTQPMSNVLSDAVAAGVTFGTGNVWAGQAAGVATKGIINYTGATNKLANFIGYNTPGVVKAGASWAYGYAKNYFSNPQKQETK